MKRYIKAGVEGQARKEMMSLQKVLKSAYDAIESCDPTIYDMFNLSSLSDELDVSIRELDNAIKSQEV